VTRTEIEIATGNNQRVLSFKSSSGDAETGGLRGFRRDQPLKTATGLTTLDLSLAIVNPPAVYFSCPC
jgi:hypothetical protein